jgi:hypothetical protein
MRRIREHLTYSNVMVTILAFIVLTGGTAVALSGTNTVFTDDITNDNVPASGGNPAGGLVAADLRPGSVGSSEVADNSLTGADVNESALAGVIRGRKLNKTLTRGAATFTKLATVGPYDINGRCLAVGVSGTRVRISAKGPAGTAEAMFNSTVGNSDDGTEGRGVVIPANVDTEFASSRTIEGETFVRIGGTAMLISGGNLVQVDFHGVADNRTGSTRCLVYGTATMGT